MALTSKLIWIGVGYVLGARAGTGRYDQIVAVTRKIAGRPELQPYLTTLTDRLTDTPSAARPTRPARTGTAVPTGPTSISPTSASPAYTSPAFTSPASTGPKTPEPASASPTAPPVTTLPGTVLDPSAAPSPPPNPAPTLPALSATTAPTPAAVPGRGRRNKQPGTP